MGTRILTGTLKEGETSDFKEEGGESFSIIYLPEGFF
jgi:hypothetical protein